MSDEKTYWNEEIPLPNEAVFKSVIVIVACIGLNHYLALGTGFIVGMTTNADEATALSAAHVFEEIYHRQNPKDPKPWKPFTVEEAQNIRLDIDSVFGLIFVDGRCHILKFSDLYYDKETDIAIFQVKKAKQDARIIFTHNIRMDADMPPIGTQIEGIGFKRMEFRAEMAGASLAMVFRGCLTRRIGVITDVLDRTIKLKGPGAYVSFPIFGGMSGGPVLRVNTGKAPAAFAVLSSDYNDPDEMKYNTHIAGTTTILKLPVKWSEDKDGRVVTFNFISGTVGTGN